MDRLTLIQKLLREHTATSSATFIAGATKMLNEKAFGYKHLQIFDV